MASHCDVIFVTEVLKFRLTHSHRFSSAKDKYNIFNEILYPYVYTKKEKDFLPYIKSYRSIYRGYRKIGGLSTVPLDSIHVNLIKNINIKVFDWTEKLSFPEQRLPLKAKAAVVISDIAILFLGEMGLVKVLSLCLIY